MSGTITDVASSTPSKQSTTDARTVEVKPQRNFLVTYIVSFKRAEDKRTEQEQAAYDAMTDVEKAIHNTTYSGLQEKMSFRHLIMIAVGGAVGTGLFVNSGASLNTGGPASLIIGWIIVATMMLSTCIALAELCVAFPVAGGFTTYATRFIDPSIGFALGWNYYINWAIMVPLQLVAAAMTIKYWNADINSTIWVVVFYLLIWLLNMLDVKYYAESEVILSMVKIIAIAAFFIIGIILVCGGGPQGGYLGVQYWYNPGAFSHGFKGVCSVFVTAAFSFGGVELVGMAAAETTNPIKTIPRACKQTFWLVTCLYVITLLLIGLLVPYNDARLLSGDTFASISPFVIAIQNAGISGLPSVMNVVILIAVLSVANSSVYASARILAGLAEAGHAPKFLTYIDRTGRPLWATIVTLLFGLLCFVASSDKEAEIFLWFSALCGLSTFFAWMTICFSHIRFRAALDSQGRGTDGLAYISQFGVGGSWYGFFMNILVIGVQFWVALFPGSRADVKSFFAVFLSLLIFLACYLGHKIVTKNWILLIRASEINIDNNRSPEQLEEDRLAIREAKEKAAGYPLWKRTYYFWC